MLSSSVKCKLNLVLVLEISLEFVEGLKKNSWNKHKFADQFRSLFTSSLSSEGIKLLMLISYSLTL
ncbi:hypothetical protein NC652_031168 [Populus alba x Populus x berolinensis]|nr:hypothetical protein NC652_031168 [Populus alba x Populus x berolinensis]